MRAEKRLRRAAARGGRRFRRLLALESGRAQETRPNVGSPAVHDCGALGSVDWYWRMANCTVCGVRPVQEFRSVT